MFPLRVRFNIVNMQKKDALYNYGMLPCVYSLQQSHLDWRHRGEAVCYYKNSCTSAADADEPARATKKKAAYVLTFTYTFAGPDVVYFAHTFPYTYTDLKKALAASRFGPDYHCAEAEELQYSAYAAWQARDREGAMSERDRRRARRERGIVGVRQAVA